MARGRERPGARAALLHLRDDPLRRNAVEDAGTLYMARPRPGRVRAEVERLVGAGSVYGKCERHGGGPRRQHHPRRRRGDGSALAVDVLLGELRRAAREKFGTERRQQLRSFGALRGGRAALRAEISRRHGRRQRFPRGRLGADYDPKFLAYRGKMQRLRNHADFRDGDAHFSGADETGERDRDGGVELAGGTAGAERMGHGAALRGGCGRVADRRGRRPEGRTDAEAKKIIGEAIGKYLRETFGLQ